MSIIKPEVEMELAAVAMMSLERAYPKTWLTLCRGDAAFRSDTINWVLCHSQRVYSIANPGELAVAMTVMSVMLNYADDTRAHVTMLNAGFRDQAGFSPTAHLSRLNTVLGANDHDDLFVAIGNSRNKDNALVYTKWKNRGDSIMDMLIVPRVISPEALLDYLRFTYETRGLMGG